PQGRVVLRAYAAGSAVRVEVEDTGIGMSSDTQGHVFDRFYRGADRDPEGFGLGLAIERQAIRGLDGRMELDSAQGEGTRVRIVLERAQVREQVPAGTPSSSSTTIPVSSTSTRSRCAARASTSTRSATARVRSRRQG